MVSLPVLGESWRGELELCLGERIGWYGDREGMYILGGRVGQGYLK